MAVGIPATVDAQTPKEDVIGLLMLAAEGEHALMVQYLYAAASLEGTAARTVGRIAVEEMGHLITIQNVLLAIAGETTERIPAIIHLGRDHLRRTSDRNPLTFTLEKISHPTLAKFVVVERPYEIADAALRLRMDELEAEAEAAGADPRPIYDDARVRCQGARMRMPGCQTCDDARTMPGDDARAMPGCGDARVPDMWRGGTRSGMRG